MDATTGDVVAEYGYDPYGKPVIEAFPNSSIPAFAHFPIRFQSKYYDTETGLYYFGYRYYDPASCKWLCRDPLQEQGGINLTAYCNGDPVNKFDPSGLAVGDLLDLETYVFNPLSMSGNEASYREKTSRDAIDKIMAGKCLDKVLTGDLPGYLAMSMGREFSYSYFTRMSRYYDMGVGEEKVSLMDCAGANYEAYGSTSFEIIPGSGSAQKAWKGVAIDDRGDGVRELATWKRMGYGIMAAVEVVGVAQTYSMMRKMVGSAATKVIPKTLAQEVGPIVNSTTSPAGAGGAATEIEADIWIVGRHGDMPKPRPLGYESHHGVNTIWMKNNIARSKADDAPGVLMKNDPFHNATRDVFNPFHREIASRQGVSIRDVDWTKVSPGTAWRLAEEQFQAAKVPAAIQEEYFSLFNAYLESLR